MADQPSVAPDRPKPKDWWDKADILIKLITGGVVVLIVAQINSTTSLISESTKKGQLTASLIDSLTRQDGGVKRDMVLATLDEIIGEERPKLICALSQQVVRSDFRNSHSTSTAAGASTNSASLPAGHSDQFIASEVASELAAKRCPTDQIQSLVNASTQPIEVSSPVPDTQGVENRTYSESDSTYQTHVLAKIGKNAVYIQYRQDWNGKDKLGQLHTALKQEKFVVPDRDEQIGSTLRFNSNVRYFYPEDRDAAVKVQGIVKSIVGSEYRIDNLSKSKFRPPKGQIEVWCSPE